MRAFGRMGAIGFLLQITTGFLAQASESEHIRIQFSAPDRCPDQGAFERALRRRITKFQLATDERSVRRFVVTITFSGSSPLGRLAIQVPGAEPSVRTVSGKSCEEVVAALALMTALAIDPSYEPDGTRSAAPGSGIRPGVDARVPPPALAPAQVPATTKETTSNQPDRSTRERPEAPTRPARTRLDATSAAPTPPAPWAWSVGAQGQATFRAPPTTGLGVALFVDASASGEGLLCPAVRLGLSASQSETTLTSGAGAIFRWATVLAEACPVRFARSGVPWAFQPCLAAHLGVLRGQGRNLDEQSQTTNLWADLGPAGRVRLTVARHLVVEAQAMALFPLRRITFEVQDAGPGQASSTIYAVPRLGALVGLGLAYEFR
jgi:hypothetical protein